MALEIKMNTRIQRGVELLLDEEANPIIDLNGTRYLIDIANWPLGTIRWTPFNISTQEIIGNNSFAYPYAHHNTFRDCILGPSSTTYPQDAITTSFPSFPVPLDNGIVRP